MKWIFSIYLWLVLNILILKVVMSLIWLKPLANKSYVLGITGKIRLYNSHYTHSVNFRPFAT
jgi:hypothetical protein